MNDPFDEENVDWIGLGHNWVTRTWFTTGMGKTMWICVSGLAYDSCVSLFILLNVYVLGSSSLSLLAHGTECRREN